VLIVVALASPSATGYAQGVSPERAFLSSAAATDRVVADSERTALTGNRMKHGPETHAHMTPLRRQP
jgi:hypothetical protein